MILLSQAHPSNEKSDRRRYSRHAKESIWMTFQVACQLEMTKSTKVLYSDGGGDLRSFQRVQRAKRQFQSQG